MITLLQITNIFGLIGFIFLLVTGVLGTFYRGQNSLKYHRICAMLAIILIFFYLLVMIKIKYLG